MAPDRLAVVVWGAGGHGRVVASVARRAGWQVAGYIDADAGRVGRVVDRDGAVCLMPEAEALARLDDAGRIGDATAVLLGIGDNVDRWQARLRAGTRVASALVHPTAELASFVTIGAGTVVMAGVVVNDGATVGEGVILNTGCVIEHDVAVANGAHVSPGAVLAGGGRVGEHAWIGANATVREGVVVGARAMVGAGAVVVGDVPDGWTVVGNPARRLERAR